MSQRVVRSIRVRRPHDEVAAFVTDPHQVLPVVPGFARFAFVTDHGEREEWDVFLEIGTLQVGGRVEVTRPSPYRLEWRSERGTRHRLGLQVAPLEDDSELSMEIEYRLSGLLMARASELLAKGIVARHVEAGLQEIRHRLEHGDVVGPGRG